MESRIDVIAEIACKRIIKYCKEASLCEPITNITIIGTYLSGGIDVSSLEACIKREGTQWEHVEITYENVPARVECNQCGTRYNSLSDWSPCPNCSCPWENAVSSTPLQIRLKEIRFESGKVFKAMKDTIVIMNTEKSITKEATRRLSVAGDPNVM